MSARSCCRRPARLALRPRSWPSAWRIEVNATAAPLSRCSAVRISAGRARRAAPIALQDFLDHRRVGAAPRTGGRLAAAARPAPARRASGGCAGLAAREPASPHELLRRPVSRPRGFRPRAAAAQLSAARAAAVWRPRRRWRRTELPFGSPASPPRNRRHRLRAGSPRSGFATGSSPSCHWSPPLSGINNAATTFNIVTIVQQAGECSADRVQFSRSRGGRVSVTRSRKTLLAGQRVEHHRRVRRCSRVVQA